MAVSREDKVENAMWIERAGVGSPQRHSSVETLGFHTWTNAMAERDGQITEHQPTLLGMHYL